MCEEHVNWYHAKWYSVNSTLLKGEELDQWASFWSRQADSGRRKPPGSVILCEECLPKRQAEDMASQESRLREAVGSDQTPPKEKGAGCAGALLALVFTCAMVGLSLWVMLT
jgi:hypothetical protein